MRTFRLTLLSAVALAAEGPSAGCFAASATHNPRLGVPHLAADPFEGDKAPAKAKTAVIANKGAKDGFLPSTMAAMDRHDHGFNTGRVGNFQPGVARN